MFLIVNFTVFHSNDGAVYKYDGVSVFALRWKSCFDKIQH